MNDSNTRLDNDQGDSGDDIARALQCLFMESPELAIYGISTGLSVAFVSPSCSNVLGIDAGTAVGSDPLAIVHAEDVPRLIQALNDVKSNSGMRTVEFRMLRPGGGLMWARSTVQNADHDTDDSGLRAVCVTRDITASKLTECLVATGGKLDLNLAACSELEELLSAVPEEIRQVEGILCCEIDIDATAPDYPRDHCRDGWETCSSRFLRGPDDASVVKAGVEQKEVVVIDVQSDTTANEAGAEYVARSFVAVPVYRGEVVLGSLRLASRYESRYLESQRDLLLNLGTRIGAEVVRLRLARKEGISAAYVLEAQCVLESRSGALVLTECNQTGDAPAYPRLESFVGRDADTLLAHCPQLLQKIHDCAHTGEEQHYCDWYHFRYCEADPRVLQARITRIDQGRIEVSANDITSQALATASRRDHERLSRVLLDTFRAFAILLGPDGRVLVINRALAEVCGQEPIVASGQPAAQVVPQDLWSVMNSQVAAAWRLNTNLCFSCRWRDRYLEWRLTLISGVGTDKARLAAVGRDVTSRVDTLAAVEASERRYRLLAENARDMISLHDADGVFEYVSPACFSLLGFSPEELIGRNPYELIYPADRQSASAVQDAALKRAGNHNLECRVRNKRGDWVWTETTVYAVADDNDRNRPRLVCVTRDVSRRKRTERDLKTAMQQLEAKHIALTEVLNRFEDEKRAASAARINQLRDGILEEVARLKRIAPEAMRHEIRRLENAVCEVTRPGTDSIRAELSGLTQREIEICLLISEGRSSRKIAEELGVSPLTVNKHRETIRRKLGLQHRRVNLRTYLRQLAL